MDVTFTNNDNSNHKHLDIIAKKVNKTIEELNDVYSEIGYTTTEISIKKSEIFSIIEDTIHNCTNSLKREKASIENECEWLRQQIKIILAMMDDAKGTKCLSKLNKGIVFNDTDLFEEGFKEEITKKLTNLKSKRENFYEDSPFNITNNSSNIMEEISFEKKYEGMLESSPKLSLMKLKRELNAVFLDVLKHFMKTFKKFNSCNLMYLDLIETIGNIDSQEINYDYLKTLPAREDAENHKELIESFESTIRHLKLSDMKTASFSSFVDNSHEDMAFVISSPRKLKGKDIEADGEGYDRVKEVGGSTAEFVFHLREINYKIVKSIRTLKMTKISAELITDLNKQINYCEVNVEERKTKMTVIISKILDLVEELEYSEDQLINLQKQFNEREKEKSDESINETFIDIETLNFIQSNPVQFGLNDSHLAFIANFLELLSKVKETKQKKYEYYLGHCSRLWEKLGEEEHYIEDFVLQNRGLSDKSMYNFKTELNRLLSKRSQYIDNFIFDTRSEIEEYWRKLYYTETEMRVFKYFDYELDPNDSYDKESILKDHENELSQLKREFESKSEILQDYEELKQLILDQDFLIESSKDSSRLLSKNSCKILLNEERIRKRVLKSMPRLIENLKKSLTIYNKNQVLKGRNPFTITGEDFYKRVLAIENEKLTKRKNNSHNKKSIEIHHSNNSHSGSNSVSPYKSQRISQMQPKRVSPSRPLSVSTSRHSPITSMNPIRKPAIKLTRNNGHPSTSRTNRIINAMSTSINGTNPGVSGFPSNQISHISNSSQSSNQVSPYGIDKHVNTSNTLLKSFRTSLQPLNSPLTADSKSGIKNSPSFSTMSPLRVNFSSIEENNKENTDVTVKRKKEDLTLNITPMKSGRLVKWDKNTSTPASESRSLGDNSSNLGEDYLQWRLEKLSQLNNA
ncbi:hypothetical protein CANTEDRAFT_118801 [Yamadazyma tenuis ATCC 10573]|uniref:Anaphase spindle elongation protein n=2 Tax=Candida tenuis TaxID=2315449 RepID=G3AYR0_CANTC|nr:uncharacterized protein CANTEDRAFT_118801 [Yamadazyma tenuis ATCC 10573]EGV65906.1 hypothetical protein CANTEDRAFT_118801 [Yamadazyma tenuis ATCC 10573]